MRRTAWDRYQEILAEGREEGIKQGLAQGLEQGLEARRVSIVHAILRLGPQRFGTPSAETTQRVSALTADEAQDTLDRLLVATSWDELVGTARGG